MTACAPTAPTVAPGAAPASPAPVSLPWMVGCWELTNGPRITRETWGATDHGALTGTVVIIEDDAPRLGETLRIDPAEAGLVYTAVPRGAEPTRFTMTERTAREVVFENPAHDFPRRIRYRRDGSDLVATIDGGPTGSTDEAKTWRYSACATDEGDAAP